MGKRHARSTAVQPKPASPLMSAIKTAPPAPSPVVSRPLLTRPEGGPALVVYQVISFLASLRLTVWLFALALLLVLFGTIAQKEQGLYTVLHSYFRCFIAWVPWQIFVDFGQVFLGVSPDARISGGFPFPGGWLLGVLLLVNVFAAHAVRFRISWKRSGVLILHSGLIVLMFHEFVAGAYQVEGQMEIAEGSSANFTRDYRKVELVVIDTSNPKFDDVTAVPGSFLRPGQTVQDERLPFNISVDRYYANSMPPMSSAQAPEGTPNPATAGKGRNLVAVETPEARGTESRVDFPAAYVTFQRKDNGDSLGTYLVTAWWENAEQTLQVNGKTYHIGLRFERIYRPYSLHLIKFSFDRIPGTNMAKNYSSKVQLVDKERGEDRPVLIRMNEPLYYRGETFYQADFDHDSETTTKLQVVRNPGWFMPYIACTLVALGMLVHFGLHLVGFVLRRFA